jgi:hypothetical protein
MADNPWFVDSLQNFWHLKCPECTFDSKEEGAFKYHAVTKHPLSLVLFGKEFNYSGVQIRWQRVFWAENQGNCQNFDTSLLT